jgi:hypothetical protein
MTYRGKGSLNREMDEIEKKLLDIFNYYNREYKPFKIEKEHKGHGDRCSKCQANEDMVKRMKRKLFNIVKVRRGSELSAYSDEYSPIGLSAGLFEYIHKVNVSNQMLMSSSYDTSFDGLAQQLISPVICLTSNELEFRNSYVHFQGCFKLLHEELREKIDFWKEYFNMATLRRGKNDNNIDEVMKKTILSQFEIV